MKINSFFKDLSKFNAIYKRRNQNVSSLAEEIDIADKINKLQKELHPGYIKCKITQIRDVNTRVREIRFEPLDFSLPFFEPGQFVSIKVNILGTITTRPYSIISSPSKTLIEKPYFEICVKKENHGFVSNYLFYDVIVGQTLECDLPHGFLYYEPLRDTKNIIAIALDMGITSFISLARAINENIIDANLTILYSTNSHIDDIYDEELNQMVNASSKIKLIHVISGADEVLRFGDETGVIDKQIITKYSLDYNPSNGKNTYFICGPYKMYSFVMSQLLNLNVPLKRIRKQIFQNKYDILDDKEYPLSEVQRFNVKVIQGLKETDISVLSIDNLAVSLEKNHITINTCCRSGVCGMCRIKVIEGDYYSPKFCDNRRRADKKFNYTYACNTYPLSDMIIKVDII